LEEPPKPKKYDLVWATYVHMNKGCFGQICKKEKGASNELPFRHSKQQLII